MMIAQRLLKALTALLYLWLFPDLTWGQLKVVPDEKQQTVFCGERRQLRVTLQNVGVKIFAADLRLRLYQTSSATAVKVSDTLRTKLQVLPGQTIIESVKLDFPAVKAETRFLVQWAEGTNKVFGRTEVLVYPQDLLKELKPLAGDQPLGVFDSQNPVKPLLKNLGLDFEDLEDRGLETFSGKLAIIGPFESKTHAREGLVKEIEALAAKGAGVVWIQPPPERRDKLQPSFYTVTVGKGAVVVVQAELLADLSECPQSQLNLIRFARLALNPEPIRLPRLSPQP
jgi:hypothetical protein